MENLRIWLTGASRGIGKAIAERLADTDSVLFLGSRTSENLKKLTGTFGMKPNIFLFPCDVAVSGEVMKTYSKIESVTGGVDVLINNAGSGTFAPFLELTEDDFDNMTGVNFKGVFNCIQAVLPGMLLRNKGMIININSVAAFTTYTGSSLYSATKAAAHAMTKTLREEVRGQGIKVVDIFPGATLTDIWSEEEKVQFGKVMMKPEDIADIVEKIIKDFDNNRMMVEEIIIRPQKGDI